MTIANGPILDARDIAVHYPVSEGHLFEKRVGTVKAVDGVSISLQPGEMLGLVGESGCGKSTFARGILRLAPLTRGEVWFEGRNLAALSREELRTARRRIQMVFQDPFASLNPRMNVSDAIAEPMRVHRLVPKRDVSMAVSGLMERVGLASRHALKYPHEFSGGQRQRIAIARALALKPALLIADEPVSALDVSVQAQILNLIASLCREERLTLLLISHDLAVVRHLSHRIAVMYLGRIVEIGDAERVFLNPGHPYSQALLSAIPSPNPHRKRDRGKLLLKGDPPSPLNPPVGCAFHPRCPYATPQCSESVPELADRQGDGHRVACVRLDELPAWTEGDKS
ncbi:MAG: ATP-binding cassette domain-containing protein [Candidatus Hydrogenedentes bacterium]|nr:ATP-binding cassette domain-containing protein [Candidatus Hydrogenedentota bacterium]